jgi:hypothetical protein
VDAARTAGSGHPEGSALSAVGIVAACHPRTYDLFDTRC